MSRMHRMCSLILTFGLALGAGCGGNNNPSPSNDAASNDAGSSDADSSDADSDDTSTPVIPDEAIPELADCPNFGELSGTISDERTLDAETCWDVPGRLTIADGGHLTVEPGVILRFAQEAGLVAEGTLTIEGSAQRKVLLTGAQNTRGYWDGVLYINTNRPGNLVKHAVIEYGGRNKLASYADAANLGVRNSQSNQTQLAVEDTILRHSASWGFWANKHELRAFSNNIVTENVAPALVSASVIDMLEPSSSFTGNDTDRITLGGSPDIGDEHVWDNLGVPLFLPHVMEVLGGVLTINAGTKLIFDQGAGLKVVDDGRLALLGEEGSEVVLTGDEEVPGFWKGVLFKHTNSPKNIVRHAIIEYGGGAKLASYAVAANLAVRNSQSSRTQLAVEDTILRHSASWGFWGNDHTLRSFSNNTITRNNQGVAIEANTVGSLDTDSTYSENDTDVILVRHGSVNGDHAWDALDAPYRIDHKMEVQGGILTIGEGAQFISSGGGIYVDSDGRLTVQGTAQNPVVFSGVEKTKGFWNGILFYNTNSSDNQINHATIEYAGLSKMSSYSDAASIGVRQTNSAITRVDLNDVTLRHSAKWGLWANSEATVNCNGVTYEDNNGDDKPTGRDCN